MAAQELAPLMVAKGEGAIVVTGNTGALRGVPSFVGFSPTKASQRILAECLARELGPQGVHVAYLVTDAIIDMPVADSATNRMIFCPTHRYRGRSFPHRPPAALGQLLSGGNPAIRGEMVTNPHACARSHCPGCFVSWAVAIGG